MDTTTTLDLVPAGTEVCLRTLRCPAALQQRLMELGWIPGTVVRCLFRGPGGSPIAFRCRGAVIALRATDAAQMEGHVANAAG